MAPTKPETQLSSELFFIASSDEVSGAALNLNKDYIMLTLQAKGKAELYFHAYFWTTYANLVALVDPQEFANCSELKRMVNLSAKPKLVVDQIKKYPFGEKEY